MTATLGGGLGGLMLGAACSRYLTGLAPMTLYATYAAFGILGLMLGVVVGTPLSEGSAMLLELSIQRVRTLQLGEIVLGAVGVLIGLFVAFFISLALQSLQLTAVPYLGVWLTPLLVLLNAALCSVSGAYVGSRLAALPSVEEFFSRRDTVKAQQVLVDTSIIVDGRLGSLLETGFLSGELVVPQFILSELQLLADSEDPLRRVRGRRGLEFLEELRRQVDFAVPQEQGNERGADQKLIQMALRLKAAILTNDYNLQKVAAVQGLRVLNLNGLASALKPNVLPGQLLQLSLQREGKESHQAVAHLDDGTMVVVERGRPHIGRDVIAEVTSVMQTATGKMVFARFRHVAEVAPQEESA